MWKTYLIGLVVAVIISIAAVYEDWKKKEITRGHMAIIIAVALSSWFAICIIVAVAIDQSEWGKKTLFNNTNKDEEAGNKN